MSIPKHRLQVIRFLNRVMIEPCELSLEKGSLSCTLSSEDVRTQHIKNILKVKDGDTIRIGVVDAGSCDKVPVEWVRSLDNAQPTHLHLNLGCESITQPIPDYNRPRVDLMLAMPRPLQLERMLPVISSLGVDNLMLINAAKVEKFYFGSHLIRNPESMRAKLVEGCSQSGSTIVPKLRVIRKLKSFLEDDLEHLFPSDKYIRVIAHPTRIDGGMPASRFTKLMPVEGKSVSETRILLAVGPEGGWDEPYELELFSKFGFQTVTLGERILRSDVAVNALLALSHEWLANT